MATTASNIHCHQSSMAEPDHERLLELTSIIASRLAVFRRIALRRLNNVADAEDAVQDALLAAYKHLRQFKGQAQLSTWLTSIVINSARLKLRRRQRRAPIQPPCRQPELDESPLVEDLTDCRPDPEEVYRHRELSQLAGRAFRRLPPTMRRTFELRAIQGLSVRETAHLLELPVGTVKGQLARARRTLRELMRIPVG